MRAPFPTHLGSLDEKRLKSSLCRFSRKRYQEFLLAYGPSSKKKRRKNFWKSDGIDWEEYILTGNRHKGTRNLMDEFRYAEALGHKIPLQYVPFRHEYMIRNGCVCCVLFLLCCVAVLCCAAHYASSGDTCTDTWQVAQSVSYAEEAASRCEFSYARRQE